MTIKCAECNKEFELYRDYPHLFCSPECEMKSKYGYIFIEKNEKAKVIECAKELNVSEYAQKNHLISDKCGYVEDYDYITGHDFGMGILMDSNYDEDIINKSDLNMCASIGLNSMVVGNVVIYNCNNGSSPIPLNLANIIVDKINNAYDSMKDENLPDWLKVYRQL